MKIEQCEHYEKSSFRNRCFLPGPNNTLSLSVPVEEGRRQKTLIRDVRISYRENWARQHWRTIHDAYRKSPFFEFYSDDIKSFFESPPAYLFDWNLQWLEWLMKQTGVKSSILFTESYQKELTDGTEDWRNKITPQTYLQFAGDLPQYMQVFMSRTGFQPNPSILDALFCEGPAVKSLLEK